MLTLDAVWQDRTHQRVYRMLLEACSFPGRVVDLAETLEGRPAELAVLSTLLDASVTFCDADGRVDPCDLARLESPPAGADAADFLLFAADAPPPEFTPRRGDVYRPHAGATVLLRCGALGTGRTGLTLRGPGIERTRRLALAGCDPAWFARREEWNADYPMGVDVVLCDATRIAALPRTTRVEVRGARITGRRRK